MEGDLVMGMEFTVDTLEDMCDLMCLNRIPKRRKNEYSDDSGQGRQGICDNILRQTSQGKADKESEVSETST